MRRDCLTPPADGTRDREVFDRFADFLAAAGPPARPPYEDRPLRPAWQRYHLRFLAWRMGQVPT